MISLILDIETTGIPERNGYCYYSPKLLKYYDNSRIIEIAYVIISNEMKILEKKSSLIIPDNFEIENSKIHGITKKMCIEEGNTMENILKELRLNIKKYNVNQIISHNVKFDTNILISECYRYNKLLAKKLLKCNKICTMENGQIFMKQRKWPKLEELYKYIFKKEIKQTHRALSDMEYCMECYIEMKKQFV
jgi:DNA polymerase III epsilon subunit-like protein